MFPILALAKAALYSGLQTLFLNLAKVSSECLNPKDEPAFLSML